MSDSYKDYCEWMEDQAAKQVQIDAFNDISKRGFSTELDALSKKLERLRLELDSAKQQIGKANYGTASEKLDDASNSLSLSMLKVNSMKLLADGSCPGGLKTSSSSLEKTIGHLRKVLFFDLDNALSGDQVSKSNVHTKFVEFISAVEAAMQKQAHLSKAL